MYDRNARLVQSCIEAINTNDRGRFEQALAPDVELRTRNRAYRGRAEALSWFDRPFEHLDLEIEPTRYVVGDDWVLCTATLRLRWRASGEIGDVAPGQSVWWLADRRIARCHVFTDVRAALAAVDLAA